MMKLVFKFAVVSTILLLESCHWVPRREQTPAPFVFLEGEKEKFDIKSPQRKFLIVNNYDQSIYFPVHKDSLNNIIPATSFMILNDIDYPGWVISHCYSQENSYFDTVEIKAKSKLGIDLTCAFRFDTALYAYFYFIRENGKLAKYVEISSLLFNYKDSIFQPLNNQENLSLKSQNSLRYFYKQLFFFCRISRSGRIMD